MVKYKQYIVDRCDGHSYGDNPEGGKPPLPCCWVPPCVKWCPWFLEQNPICPCKAFGHVGCTKAQNDDSTRVRRIVFTIGLLANIIGLGLTVFSCFAVSKDHGILTTASFSEGRVDPVDPTSTVESIEIWIGLRAVAGRNPNSPVQDTVTGFDEFCDLLEEELERYINDEQCGDCEESSQAYVGSVISSTVLYLPSIFTDILRMYPTYDLNCQKFYGAIVAFISIALTMYTLLNYSNACFDGFYQGQVEYFVGNSTPVPDGYTGDAETVLMDFDWNSGNGLICLSVATILKLVDAICNLIVPVPSIAYTEEEQEAYELQYGPGAATDDLKLDQEEEQPQDGEEAYGEE